MGNRLWQEMQCGLISKDAIGAQEKEQRNKSWEFHLNFSLCLFFCFCFFLFSSSLSPWCGFSSWQFCFNKFFGHDSCILINYRFSICSKNLCVGYVKVKSVWPQEEKRTRFGRKKFSIITGPRKDIAHAQPQGTDVRREFKAGQVNSLRLACLSSFGRIWTTRWSLVAWYLPWPWMVKAEEYCFLGGTSQRGDLSPDY